MALLLLLLLQAVMALVLPTGFRTSGSDESPGRWFTQLLSFDGVNNIQEANPIVIGGSTGMDFCFLSGFQGNSVGVALCDDSWCWHTYGSGANQKVMFTCARFEDKAKYPSWALIRRESFATSSNFSELDWQGGDSRDFFMCTIVGWKIGSPRTTGGCHMYRDSTSGLWYFRFGNANTICKFACYESTIIDPASCTYVRSAFQHPTAYTSGGGGTYEHINFPGLPDFDLCALANATDKNTNSFDTICTLGPTGQNGEWGYGTGTREDLTECFYNCAYLTVPSPAPSTSPTSMPTHTPTAQPTVPPPTFSPTPRVTSSTAAPPPTRGSKVPPPVVVADDDDESSDRSSGLSSGALIGLVVGSLIFVALVIGAIIFCVCYKRKLDLGRPKSRSLSRSSSRAGLRRATSRGGGRRGSLNSSQTYPQAAEQLTRSSQHLGGIHNQQQQATNWNSYAPATPALDFSNYTYAAATSGGYGDTTSGGVQQYGTQATAVGEYGSATETTQLQVYHSPNPSLGSTYTSAGYDSAWSAYQ